MLINGHTKQLAIIGKPVEHSFSPQMHNFFSEITKNNYSYSAWETDSIEDAIKGIRAMNIRGVNVTAPYKKDVIQYLDDVDDTALLLGSVNTVVNSNGRLKGYNTDAEGFYRSLINAGINITGKNILVIGAGGAAQPAVMRFVQAKPKSITVVNRTKSKADKMRCDIFEKLGFDINTEFDAFANYDVVINTTSAGMTSSILPTVEIDGIDNLDFINSECAAADMIYNPPETLFLQTARKKGAKTINGLGMLIYQGIIAYELFTETNLPDDIYERVKEYLIKEKILR